MILTSSANLRRLLGLDRWLEDDEPEILWGVVSMGDAWRFGFLQPERSHLTQDLRLYRVPDDLERLVGSLVAILANQDQGPCGG